MTFRSKLMMVSVLLAGLALPAVAQQPQWGRPRPPKVGACFYRESEWRGDYFCLKMGERWPSMPYGFNDKISSVRVFRGAVVRVFTDAGFNGESLRIDNDLDSLKRVPLQYGGRTWNDQISSIAVFRDNDEWDRGHRPGPQGPPPRPR